MQNPVDLKNQIAAEIAIANRLDTKQAFVQTWSNSVAKNGFKLTGYGFFELKQRLQYWSIPIQISNLSSKDLLRLHRVMRAPWYADHRGFHVFDSEIAVQLTLYNNDLVFWLEAQSENV